MSSYLWNVRAAMSLTAQSTMPAPASSRSDGVLVVEAKYTLESHDGVLIMVNSRGLRHGPPAVIERLARGEAVDPQEYYFRTAAEFEAPAASTYAWLNRAVFVGVAERTAKAAIIRFHEVT